MATTEAKNIITKSDLVTDTNLTALCSGGETALHSHSGGGGGGDTYTDAGDLAAYDFIKANFTLDSAWHDLDLSSIVPEGATAVLIHTEMRANGASGHVMYRENGNTNVYNRAYALTQVANVYFLWDSIVALDENRVIEYNIDSGVVWSYINVQIRGWWI